MSSKKRSTPHEAGGAVPSSSTSPKMRNRRGPSRDGADRSVCHATRVPASSIAERSSARPHLSSGRHDRSSSRGMA